MLLMRFWQTKVKRGTSESHSGQAQFKFTAFNQFPILRLLKLLFSLRNGVSVSLTTDVYFCL